MPEDGNLVLMPAIWFATKHVTSWLLCLDAGIHPMTLPHNSEWINQTYPRLDYAYMAILISSHITVLQYFGVDLCFHELLFCEKNDDDLGFRPYTITSR